MNERKRYICAVIAHALLLAAECIAFYPNPFTKDLMYYTQLSNLLALFVSFAYVLEAVPRLKKGKTAPSACLRVLSYAAVCVLTVTMLVVIFILSPMQVAGGFVPLMFSGPMLYMHFLCPVIALISFLLFEKEPPLTKKHLFLALLPTLLYAAAVIPLNILRVLRGPYPFLYVYEQPVYMSVLWSILVLGGAFLIAWLLKKLGGGAKRAAEA